MKVIVCFLIPVLLIVTGCSYSLREDVIRDQRPDFLKTYKGGPISSLTPKDIEEAIEFGKINKHNQDVINYAFMFAKDTSDLLTVADKKEYVLICTNYYLIADYAAKQARNYEDIDMDYVNFLARLPAFKIEAMEQIGGVWYQFQIGSKFVLLKDGNKVEEFKQNLLYKDVSPYAESHFSGQTDWEEKTNEILRKNMELANKISSAYQKDMSSDMKKLIPIEELKNVYEYKNINSNSKYEVVIIYNDKEIHVPIDFLNIK